MARGSPTVSEHQRQEIIPANLSVLQRNSATNEKLNYFNFLVSQKEWKFNPN